MLTYIVCFPIKKFACLLIFFIQKDTLKKTHLTIGNKVRYLFTIIPVAFVIATSFLFVSCKTNLEHNRHQKRLFVKKGRIMRTWNP